MRNGKSAVFGYLLATAATGLVLLARLGLNVWLGERAPFLPFVIAVVLSAWVGGWGPGLLATGLSALLGGYFFAASGDDFFWLAHAEEMIELVIFLVAGVLVSWVCGRMPMIGGVNAGREILDRKQLEETLRQQGAGLQRQNERLELLWQAASVLVTANDLDAMLRGLFAKIAPHLGLEAYFNFVVSEAGDELQLASCSGIPEEAVASLERLEFRRGICDTIPLEREPITVCRIQESADPRVELLKGLGMRAYASNPLLVGKRLLGTLSFASRSRDELDDDELDFLRTISQYVTSAYERLRLLNELRTVDRRKDEFLATLGHELRNPLAPLRIGLDLLGLEGARPVVLEQARSIMEGQLAQMVRLVDDLLDVSRIRSNKIGLKRADVELQGVIASAVETSRPLIEAGGLELCVALPDDRLFLNADAARLTQVFSNLLNNAAKFTPSGGRIRLTAERDGSDVIVRVSDSGMGIPPDMLPRIFDMFMQVERSLERSQGGLGLGLPLVKRLVEMHGGFVSASSEGEGCGSEFAVRLPLVAAPSPSKNEPDWNGRKAQTASRRILVVDDQRVIARMLKVLLEELGHQVQMAHDGEEAIAAAESFRPDLALLDIGLPKLNGHEVAKRIRREPWGKEMVLVAQTGYGQEEDRIRSEKAGFDHHVVKPVSKEVLEELLAQLPSMNQTRK